MLDLIPLSELFNVVYGVNLELINLEQCEKKDANSINFVSRTEKTNGIVAFVKKIPGLEPNPKHTISVAGGGSVLASFYQPEDYYSGRDLYVLLPRKEFSVIEMIFYANCIRQNRYRYNYGRQANKTLRDILIPRDLPNEYKKIRLDNIVSITNTTITDVRIELNTTNWKAFKYGGKEGIFIIKGGYYNKKPEHIQQGNIPFIGSSEYNNGVTEYYTYEEIANNDRGDRSPTPNVRGKIFKANCVTVANNGASVSSAFYQERDFTCSHDVNILYLKNREWNKFIALFICTIIRLEKYRWNYGRKWRPSRMPDSEIRLPVTKDGNPDWSFMENYIKSLPFSAAI